MFKESFLLQGCREQSCNRKDFFSIMDQNLISRLSAVAEQEKKRSSKQILSAIVVYLGADVTEHFPKLKDAQGKTVKDEEGKDKRSDASDGFTHTFSEVGTSKVVKIVCPKKLNLEMLTAYQVSGFGYSMGSMLYIDEGSKITLYQ